MSDLALLLHHDDTEPPKPDPETEQEELNSGGDGEDHDESPAQSGTDSGDGNQEDDEDYVMKDEPSDDYPAVKNEANSDGNNNNTVKQESADDDEDGAKLDSTKAEVPTKVTQQSILSLFEKIKTHFPAARIKKIMQLDDDIGKVAQATPIIVGRALEIFMANLVECAIIELRKQGVKRILAMHIRAAVENLEQFDFLVDLVAKYPPMKH